MQYSWMKEGKLIILIYPKDPNNTKNSSSFVQASLDMPPLGLMYLGTVIKKSGESVKIFDFNCLENDDMEEELLQKIVQLSPSVIGFSVATTSYPYTYKLAQKMKDVLKKTVFVWGGYHVSFQPEEPLRKGVADIVIRGEGEETILKIIRTITDYGSGYKQYLKTIEGISYIYHNQIHHNQPDYLVIKDLDSVPIPDRSLLDLRKYKNASTILASRGCVGRCKFCASACMGTPREREVSSVISEMDILVKKYGYRHINFVDNVFAYNKKRTKELLEAICERQLPVTFSAEVNINFMDEEVISLFKKAGLNFVQFGIESGSNKILESINKMISIEKAHNIVKKCLEENIHVVCSMMIGLPEDTEETIAETVTMAKQFKKEGAQIVLSCMVPYPGSEVFDRASDLGIKIENWDFAQWNMTNRSVISTKYLSRKKINKLYNNALSELNAI